MSASPSRPERLVVVAGTGTEVGKTWMAARLLESWRGAGLSVAARKPVQSFDPGAGPTDAEVLARASGETPNEVCPPSRWYSVALAPPMAARRLGLAPPRLAELLGELSWPAPVPAVGLVETAGGLRSPQVDDGDAVDLAAALGPDIVCLVADAGLGTISAVRLAAVALHGADLAFVVVLNRYDAGDALHVENLLWLRQRDGLDVLPGDADGIGELARRLAPDLSVRARG